MPKRESEKQETTDPVLRYETLAKELEGIVTRMERGELPLEESLQLFERGMVLSAECRKMLDEAELKVKNVLEKHPPADRAG